MSNYLDKQSYTTDHFQLEVYPYIAVPDALFEQNAALQYGADFKLKYSRAGTQTQLIGLIQLIFPQTQLFARTQVGKWNVDKRDLGAHKIIMANCLYSDDNVRIGTHSKFYLDQLTRKLTVSECSLIDTPREITTGFDPKTGEFGGVTNTKFANYVVELRNANGVIFNDGFTWGYSVVQDRNNKRNFTMAMVEPRICRLKESNEHLEAIARFLNSDRATVASYASS